MCSDMLAEHFTQAPFNQWVESTAVDIEFEELKNRKTDALAGMALVFPAVMLMQMSIRRRHGRWRLVGNSAGAGCGPPGEADALVKHALVINVALGAFCFSIVMLAFGPARSFARLRSRDRRRTTDAALSYSNVVFAGNVAALASMNGVWQASSRGDRQYAGACNW